MEIKKTYNPLTLSHDYRTFENEGLSPNQFIERENIIFTRPVVLLVNGVPVLRKSWDMELKQADVCHFVELPRGGDSDPIRIVLMVAVIALSLYTGGAVGAAYGPLWGAIAQGVILVGGMMLVNYFFQPSMPIGLDASGVGEQQRIGEFNINSGRNTIQLGSPFPEPLGQFLYFPCLVMSSYAEYASNKQYFYMIGIIGVGEYQIDDVYIDKTPIGDYSDTSYNIIPPSGTPTLCPKLVFTCTGISGQELSDTWLTSIISTAGTEISQIGFDIVFNGGLGEFNDTGDICSYSVNVRAEARRVDDEGAALTAWTLLRDNIYAASTVSPLRYSWKTPVPDTNGRYEFRIKRSVKSTSTKVVNAVHVEQLRGYGAAHPDYGDLTLIEVKIKATDELNGMVAQKINVRGMRKLYPVTTTGFGISKVATKSIVDSCAYIVTSDNGGKQPDSVLDFETLTDLKTILAARENYFSHIFSGRTTVMESCKIIARCGRAVPYMPGGLFSLVRDKLQTVPAQVYTDDDYTENSINLDHIIRTDDDPTCVEIEYTDADTWQKESVTYYDLGGSLENPAIYPLIGCTSRQHAWEEAAYMYKDDELNRTAITFTTGLKGNIPKLGDMVYVASRHVDWGQTGQLAHISATVATLSEPVDFGETAYEGKLLLTSKTGGVLGPYNVTPGDCAHSVMIALSSDDVNTIHTNGEKATKFLFGPTLDEILRVRVLKILPTSNNEVRIVGSIIHDEVHEDPEEAPPPASLPIIDLPFLDDLSLMYRGVTGSVYEYYVIWNSSEDKFRVELDEGSGYFILADNLEAYGYAFTTTTLNITVKVTPYIDGVLTPAQAKTASFVIPAAPTGLNATDDDVDVTITWNSVPDVDYYELKYKYGETLLFSEKIDPSPHVVSIDDVIDWVFSITGNNHAALTFFIRAIRDGEGGAVGPWSSQYAWQWNLPPAPASFTSIFYKDCPLCFVEVIFYWSVVWVPDKYGTNRIKDYVIWKGDTSDFDPVLGEGEPYRHIRVVDGACLYRDKNFDLDPVPKYFRIAAYLPHRGLAAEPTDGLNFSTSISISYGELPEDELLTEL